MKPLNHRFTESRNNSVPRFPRPARSISDLRRSPLGPARTDRVSLPRFSSVRAIALLAIIAILVVLAARS